MTAAINACSSTSLNVIPEAVLAPLASDGQVVFKFYTSSKVSAADVDGVDCDFNGEHDISAYIAGTMTYQAGPDEEEIEEILQDTISTAGSLSNSRRSVTIANLPRLSGRMGGGRIGGAPSAGGALPAPSTPSAPSPPTPSGGAGGAPASSGGGSSGGGGVITGSGTSDQGFFSFSGDLRSIRNAAAAQLSETDPSASAMQVNTGAYPVDVWFGGSYTYFESATGNVSQNGDIATFQMGIDSRLSADLLVGMAAFGDVLFSDVSNSTETEGVGFMTGPYFVATLDGPLFLEGLAAVGRAYNRIISPTSADARYQSDRLLLTSRVSGDWAFDAWSFRPSSRVIYYSEWQESFTDSAGSVVPKSQSELGQLRFGPEIGFELNMTDSSARPYLGVEGVWTFLQTDQIVDGRTVGSEEFTGALAFGLDGRWGRTTFRAGGRVDGVGDESADSYSGELTVRMPLD